MILKLGDSIVTYIAPSSYKYRLLFEANAGRASHLVPALSRYVFDLEISSNATLNLAFQLYCLSRTRMGVVGIRQRCLRWDCRGQTAIQISPISYTA